MGYTTDFTGEFKVTPSLTKEHREYLIKFSETRRVARNSEMVEKLNDKKRLAVDLEVGIEGENFTGGLGFGGQDRDASILDTNRPPSTQPGLWCQWIPNEQGTAIVWDECEKFYDYVEWIAYLIDNFFDPWGYVLNGSVNWSGESADDAGLIIITENSVRKDVVVLDTYPILIDSYINGNKQLLAAKLLKLNHSQFIDFIMHLMITLELSIDDLLRFNKVIAVIENDEQ